MFWKLNTTIPQHTSIAHTKPIPMVIIALYLKKDVWFGEVRIPFMLVKCITSILNLSSILSGSKNCEALNRQNLF